MVTVCCNLTLKDSKGYGQIIQVANVARPGEISVVNIDLSKSWCTLPCICVTYLFFLIKNIYIFRRESLFASFFFF